MSNNYFDWPTSANRLVRGDFARAEDVNDAFDSVSSGMDSVEADTLRSLKVPPGSGLDLTLNVPPGMRANKALVFGPNGNTLSASSTSGTFVGDWAAGTRYLPSEMLRDPATKNIYSVLVDHVATTVVADLAAGKLRIAVNVADVEAARDAAAASATASANSASASAGSAGASAVAASSSSGSAAAALASQSAAAASQAAASGSATNAANSAALAQNWAIKTDGPVSGGELSAKKHAQIAGQHAADAAASAGAPPASTTYTWNPNGTLASSNADGLVTTYSWRADGRLNTMSFPRAGKTRTETFNWDSVDTNKLNSVTAVEV